jgi:hypothetical protein
MFLPQSSPGSLAGGGFFLVSTPEKKAGNAGRFVDFGGKMNMNERMNERMNKHMNEHEIGQKPASIKLVGLVWTCIETAAFTVARFC